MPSLRRAVGQDVSPPTIRPGGDSDHGATPSGILVARKLPSPSVSLRWVAPPQAAWCHPGRVRLPGRPGIPCRGVTRIARTPLGFVFVVILQELSDANADSNGQRSAEQRPGVGRLRDEGIEIVDLPANVLDFLAAQWLRVDPRRRLAVDSHGSTRTKYCVPSEPAVTYRVSTWK